MLLNLTRRSIWRRNCADNWPRKKKIRRRFVRIKIATVVLRRRYPRRIKIRIVQERGIANREKGERCSKWRVRSMWYTSCKSAREYVFERRTKRSAKRAGGVKPPELKLQSPQIRRSAAKSKRRPRIKTRLVLREPRGEKDEADPRNRNVIKVKR